MYIYVCVTFMNSLMYLRNSFFKLFETKCTEGIELTVATTVTTTSTTEAAITAGAGSQSSSGTASEQKSST